MGTGNASPGNVEESTGLLPDLIKESTPKKYIQGSSDPGPYSIFGFPEIVGVHTRCSRRFMEAYSRALLLQGHGIPLWYPQANLDAPAEYNKRGVSIGDVGVLSQRGSFYTAFNIFLPADHPSQTKAPREFQPFGSPPTPSEIRFIPDYHKPGTVITSSGVTVQRNAENPLDVSFSSQEIEAGILILPEGASREDLIHTQHLHEYVRRNAPHWYQAINRYGGITYPNGSLMVVTGCDKADDWASASFPHDDYDELELRYVRQPNYGRPWVDKGTAFTRYYFLPVDEDGRDIPRPKGSVRNQCVFVRGLQISLSSFAWVETMPLYQVPNNQYYTLIRHTPSPYQSFFDGIKTRFRLQSSETEERYNMSILHQLLFQPNYVIGQVLLGKFPDAEIALVEDSSWCSLAQGGGCSIEAINEIVTKILSTHRIVENDGIVTLVSSSEDTKVVHTPLATKNITRWAAWTPYLLRKTHNKDYVKWVQHVSLLKFVANQ